LWVGLGWVGLGGKRKEEKREEGGFMHLFTLSIYITWVLIDWLIDWSRWMAGCEARRGERGMGKVEGKGKVEEENRKGKDRKEGEGEGEDEDEDEDEDVEKLYLDK
jgi:hypothetical protein